MENNLTVLSFCSISSKGVVLNDKFICTQNHDDKLSTYLKEIYTTLGISYGKFFKMDLLSKLCFLGAEILFTDKKKFSTQTALLFSNRSGSLQIDKKHQNTIQQIEDYYPSPANFVYTLPNIGLGEISIKHKLFTEHSFFIFDEINIEFLNDYAQMLLQENNLDQVMCAWVEYNQEGCDAFFYLLKNSNTKIHTTEKLKSFYKKYNG